MLSPVNDVVVQWLSHVQLCATPGTAAHQASLSFTISQNLFKLRFVESVMPFNHLILCCPLLFLPSIFPSIRVFSNDSALHIRWPKYRRSFNFSFPGGSDGKESACNVEDLGLILGLGRSRGGGHGNPLQYSCLENPHGQTGLAGYSPWGHKGLGTTEQLSTDSATVLPMNVQD